MDAHTRGANFQCRDLEQRLVADEEAHVLLFEPASTVNTAGVKDERTAEHLERI
jgi:hypothetical protein